MTGLPTVGGDSGTWGTILNAYLTEREVGYGTSLPGSPVDGQRYILVDSTTNPTYQWSLRFNSGSSSAYKWEFVGGAPVRARVNANEQCTSNTYTALATSGPSITLPRAGDYDIVEGFNFNNANAGSTSFMSFDIGATPADDSWGVAGYNASIADVGVNVAEHRRLTGLSAVTLTMKYRVSGSNGWFGERVLDVVPVRVA